MIMKPVVFVLGPTAAGKSEFALTAAQEWGAAILNCDSVQCYKGVDIGAAKPNATELKLVPHLLFDWVQPPDELTAAKFQRQAMQTLASESRLVFAVGGSGFYIRALEKGVHDVKPVPDERKNYWKIRALEVDGPTLHKELEKLDPEYAAKLSPNDSYRIVRALMVIENENKTMTTIRREFAEAPSTWPYRSVKIGFRLARAELASRIEERTLKMMGAGWKAEVEALLVKGLAKWAPLQSVGYREMVQHLQGEIPESELVGRVVKSTLQLAKKQMTWFNADSEIHWFDSKTGQEEAIEFLRAVDLNRGHPE